jgi:hypothetical protein
VGERQGDGAPAGAVGADRADGIEGLVHGTSVPAEVVRVGNEMCRVRAGSRHSFCEPPTDGGRTRLNGNRPASIGTRAGARGTNQLACPSNVNCPRDDQHAMPTTTRAPLHQPPRRGCAAAREGATLRP